MSDRQVSIDGQTHPLPRPFMVIATQNPFEFEGTYPLPESQLDRFLLCTKMGYPSRSDELQVLSAHRRGEPVEDLPSVLSCEQVLSLQAAVREVVVENSVQEYLMDLVEATRNNGEVHVGVSTRGALSLYRASQALALVAGRQYVVPDDLKLLAGPVMAHRIITKGFLHSGQRGAVESLIQRMVEEVPVPG
jgi:MoxR-like ATPase